MKQHFFKNLKNIVLYSAIPYIVWNLGSDAIWNIIDEPEWSLIAVREALLEIIISAIVFLIIDIIIVYIKTKREIKNISNASGNMKEKSIKEHKKKDIVISFLGVILVCSIVFFWNNGIQKIFSISANYKLYFGIENEQKAKVENAIKEGADVNKFPFWLRICAEDVNKYTPLTYAATYNDNKEIINILVKNGAEINAMDDNGHTPIETAVIELNKNQVDYFLQRNVKGNNNLLEVLFDSVEENEIFYLEYPYRMEQMVTYLKSKDIRITKVVEKKAIDSEYYGAIKEIVSDDTCYHKIEENDFGYVKSHLPRSNKEKKRLFQYAAAFGTQEMCEYLLSTGVNIDAGNRKESTALMTACQYGNLENAKYLVKHGAKVSSENAYSESCLYMAAMYKQKDVCNWLLKNYKDEVYGQSKELDREVDEWMKEMKINF